MIDAARRRTLPVRVWFALAAVTTFLLVVAGVLASVGLLGASDITSEERISSAVDTVREGGNRWHDDRWRAEAAAELADDGVSLVLTERGDEVFRSLVDTGGDDEGAEDVWDADRGNGLVRYVDITADPPLTAQLYTPLRGDDPVPGIVRAALFISLVAIAVALAFGRPFIRSLRAVQHAARSVAEGDMAVALPRSRITEVDEVNTAFAAMTTELNHSLEQQAALELERRLFIAAIAHDLRTPLFSLRGHLDGLESGVADTPEKRERYLAIVNEKARTLDRLVAELFDYTRLEYLGPAMERTALDLAELLEDLVDGLRPQADANDVRLELFPHDHSCPIEADREQLARAVTNVIDNALRHTPAGGRIDVACGIGDDRAWFTVSDTGPGIDPKDLPHLFQPLYRGGADHGTAPEGAGLGLAIAQRILVAHHGTLEAGNNEHGGAVFTASLPSRAEPDAAR
ncbi:sensor histidine kinase [Desertimonas flava]|uniref:sensor histidine kinase n=1 Tax=Desertimonas flava TaxID=2064846 RepID=UPI000E356B0B|nr:HAMP domain-containing sensor histidine kinase [Desertimonas flava]